MPSFISRNKIETAAGAFLSPPKLPPNSRTHNQIRRNGAHALYKRRPRLHPPTRSTAASIHFKSRRAGVKSAAAMELGNLHKVWEIRALKTKPEAAAARELLDRVARQVQPIMRRHKWRVKVLSEFS